MISIHLNALKQLKKIFKALLDLSFVREEMPAASISWSLRAILMSSYQNYCVDMPKDFIESL